MLLPYLDRMETPEECAVRLKRWVPGSPSDLRPRMLFGQIELVDNGERDKEGRRIFA